MNKWLNDQNMCVYSDGKSTRKQSESAKKSITDIVISHSKWIGHIKTNTLNVGPSDHMPILTTISLTSQITNSKKKIYWIYKKADKIKFNKTFRQLMGVRWQTNKNEAVSKAKQIASSILVATKSSIPTATLKNKKNVF